jgi:predicted NAD/FAD-dependent oxidoreductase
MNPLAIIGAGPAGLAAAWKLKDSGLMTTVFEKSRGLCGRAASRTRHGVRLDPGANYIKTGSPEIEDLLLRELPSNDLARIERDVWTFDADSRIQEGDPKQNREPRWNYRSGISTLGKLLAAQCRAEIRRETRIACLHGSAGQWTLVDSDGARFGPFGTVLLTPPGPQTIKILEASELQDRRVSAVVNGLLPAQYFRQFCFAFGFKGSPERPGKFHALINSDRQHPIAWLSFENDKPGHVPAGTTVVIAQMQPDWSARYYDEKVEALVGLASQHATNLLQWPDLKADWFDVQRWKFAHPFKAAEQAALRAGEDMGIYVAGDALVGKGRVNLALETGLRAAERILDRLR